MFNLPQCPLVPPQGTFMTWMFSPWIFGPSLLKAKLLAGLLAEGVSLDSTDTDKFPLKLQATPLLCQKIIHIEKWDTAMDDFTRGWRTGNAVRQATNETLKMFC